MVIVYAFLLFLVIFGCILLHDRAYQATFPRRNYPVTINSKFSEETLDYLLRSPIKIDNLYIHVGRIETNKTVFGGEISFNFQVKEDDRTVIWQGDRVVVLEALVGTVYGYTFTALNSFEFNRANLEDFVRTEWPKEKNDPLLEIQ